MNFGPPNMDSLIFDTSIITKPSPVDSDQTRQTFHTSKKKFAEIRDNINLYTKLFSELDKLEQRLIISGLLSEFKSPLDVHRSTRIFYLAKSDNYPKIIGIICSQSDETCFQLLRKKGFNSLDLGLRSNAIYIYNLWIATNWRQTGLANQLLKQVETYYKQHKKQSIRCQVIRNNYASYHLFTKRDYLIEQRFTNTQGQVILTLCKWLDM